MTIQRMIELLAFERKCVKSADECDRNCTECNLVQDTNELLEMYSEVILLLKAQEPMEPIWRRGLAFCGKCGRQFGRWYKYCPDCGRAVKWE